jgi:conjugative transfer signal peptidase TraF
VKQPEIVAEGRDEARGSMHRALRRRTSVAAALGIGLLAAAEFATPRLVWNASASAPIGLYRRMDGVIARGDLVLAWAPDPARRLAAERDYLPADVPLLKRVAAIAGDTVCAIGRSIVIDGRAAAERLERDPSERPLPRWDGCLTLQPGELFLLMPGVPDSFDGRYFGAVGADAVIGKVVPLWTE